MAHVAIHLPWSNVYIPFTWRPKSTGDELITRSSWGLQIPLPTAPCFVLFPSSCLPKLLFSIKKQRKTRVHIGMKQHAAILRSRGKMKILRMSRFRLKSPLLAENKHLRKALGDWRWRAPTYIAPSPGSSLCSAGSSSVVRITPSVACGQQVVKGKWKNKGQILTRNICLEICPRPPSKVMVVL